jgi:hypothetical protein
MYMSAIGLARATDEQKLVHEIIWSAILDDRLSRGGEDHNRSTINTYFVRLRDLAIKGAEAAAAAQNKTAMAAVTPPYLGSLLPPQPQLAASESAGNTSISQPPSLNIPHVHCAASGGGGIIKEEAPILHVIKLEAGTAAAESGSGFSISSGSDHYAGRNVVAAMKPEPDELTLTTSVTAAVSAADMKRRLEEYDEPPGCGGDEWTGRTAAKQWRRPQQPRQNGGGISGGGETESGGQLMAWPGIQAIEQAYRKYREGELSTSSLTCPVFLFSTKFLFSSKIYKKSF